MTSDKWTDKELSRLEKRIESQFSEAEDDLKETALKYFNGWDEDVAGKTVHHMGMHERLAKEEEAYLEGKYTDEQWKAYQLSQYGRGAHWTDLQNQMSDRMLEASEIATKYTNDLLPSIYVSNSNEVAKIVQKSAIEDGVTGIRFDLADESTVKRLMMQSREVRPYKKIELSVDKATRYNKTKLQNALLQGILQGDSIDHIADRFTKVVGMSRACAVRNARTAVTGAQNAGKQDRYENLEAQGVVMTKIWQTTMDGRERPEHGEANGQEVSVDEPFDVGGEELMYPADDAGSPWNIYNCRCTMKMGKPQFRSTLSDELRRSANIRIVGE